MKKVLYILAELSDRDFSWLITAGKRLRIPAGTTLIEEGKSINALYIILDGSFAVSTEALGGGEIAQLTSGEVVGEISFVDSRPPTATVTALENSLVWAISRGQLSAKLLQDANFAAHFYHALAMFLADRLRVTVGRLGYSKAQHPNQDMEATTSDEDLNPDFLSSLEIAQYRLDWLLNRLNDLR
ncbi:MAG TPA: cyclic nucleotide-binding protein [Cyanobacteria bacterium UBA8803]|nr:cyclic nucleotide-binding protein [Cyanobacteria bacterium UBA9273]HBL61796.1 cyclic nucleotide-binding protein [Cyanobacteria bacterium UBA8803]